MEQTRFRGRALTALLMLLSFALLASTGLILFFAPRGRIANATSWDLLGLSRWQWEDLHASFALLMLAAALPHIWMNRKPLLNHLRQRAAALAVPLLPVRFEVLAAAALCVTVLAGTIWQVPPVSYVSQVRSEMRGAHEPSPPSFTGARRGWRHSE
jgi:ABC-type Fe3+-siderophore transport system permease subunit